MKIAGSNAIVFGGARGIGYAYADALLQHGAKVLLDTNHIQARSELRFWRGAEVDKVQNPKQLYAINLGKIVSF